MSQSSNEELFSYDEEKEKEYMNLKRQLKNRIIMEYGQKVEYFQQLYYQKINSCIQNLTINIPGFIDTLKEFITKVQHCYCMIFAAERDYTASKIAFYQKREAVWQAIYEREKQRRNILQEQLYQLHQTHNEKE
jgi:hypothetical protein